VFYINLKTPFDFFVVGEFTTEIRDIIDGVRRKLFMEPTTISNFKIPPKKSQINSKNLIVFLNYFLFHNDYNDKQVYLSLYTGNEKILVYLYNVELQDEMIPFTYQYFLSNFVNHSEIILNVLDVTEDCGYTNRQLNAFHKVSRKWKEKLENFEHLQNYHGCVVFIASLETKYSSLDFPSLPFEVAKMVGTRTNFTITELDRLGDSLVDRRIQVGLPQYMYGDDNYDYIMASFYHLEVGPLLLMESTWSTTSFENYKMTFMITPGEPFTNFEKLYLPFDFETWKYLFITFGSAFLLIVIINRLERKIKNLVYGKNVRNPAFNVVSIFFGIG
jgi:hypothetical protein